MDYKLLENAPLFKDVPPEEINVMLQCLGTEERDYDKGETIFHAGDVIHNIGLVLTGRVQIENDDVWGNKSVMESVGPGFAFAESYACLPGEPLMVSAIAAEPSHILFLDTGRVLTTCPSACTHHNRLIQNLLYISSQKNLNLSRRIFHTSSKSIRGRLLSYLSFQASKAGSRDFCIPFNRQQLADYLSIDRSAMSAELGKMRKEGILETDKNHFVLKTDLLSAFCANDAHSFLSSGFSCFFDQPSYSFFRIRKQGSKVCCQLIAFFLSSSALVFQLFLAFFQFQIGLINVLSTEK